MTERKSTSRQSVAVDDRVDKILSALEYQAELIQRSQDADPESSIQKAKRIVDASTSRKIGKNQWRVTVPGFRNPVDFWADAETENEAIREFEHRFGTRFRKNAQKDSDNHEIERATATA